MPHSRSGPKQFVTAQGGLKVTLSVLMVILWQLLFSRCFSETNWDVKRLATAVHKETAMVRLVFFLIFLCYLHSVHSDVDAHFEKIAGYQPLTDVRDNVGQAVAFVCFSVTA